MGAPVPANDLPANLVPSDDLPETLRASPAKQTVGGAFDAQGNPSPNIVPDAGPHEPAPLGVSGRVGEVIGASPQAPSGPPTLSRMVERAIPTLTGDYIVQGIGKALGAGGATIAGIAEDLGASPAMANRLERDVPMIADSAGPAMTMHPSAASNVKMPRELSRSMPERLKATPWTGEQVAAAGKDLNVKKSIGKTVSKAEGIINKRVNQDAPTPTTAQEVIDRLNRARTSGKPMMLMDVLPDNVQGLAGKVARTPGESRQIISGALRDRNAGAVDRLTGDINAGLGKEGAYDARESLVESRRNAAKPKYESAFSRIAVLPEEAERVERFVADPIGQHALNEGMRVVQLEHLRDGTEFKPADYGIVRGEDGKWVLEPGKRTLRMYDAVKRGYDEIVEGFRDKTTGRLVLNQYANAVNGVRAMYTNTLREMFPRYADALNAWGGPSKSIDALQVGSDALRRSPEQNAARLAGMTEDDKEYARLGVAQSLRDIANKRGPLAPEFSRIAGTQYGSASTRAQLLPFFKDEASLDKFINSVTAEGTMARTANRILSGSQTAERLAEDGISAGEVARAAMTLGRPHRMLDWAIRNYENFTGDPRVNSEIARTLGRTDVDLEMGPNGKLKIVRKPLAAGPQASP